MQDQKIRDAIAALLANRHPPATICPSEAARALAPEAWRPLMPQVRTVAFAMASEGTLEIRQGGQTVPPTAELRGPIRLGHAAPQADRYPSTPDGRYFVVRGRLWRKSNPGLAPEVREELVRLLMDARRALRGKRSEEERRTARAQVEQAKRSLGERGPVWWSDGAPDFNRKMAVNTPYKEWFLALPGD
ncbi:MAG: DUF3253 domain-containing protein [Burkholderiaceae bacterium]